MNGVVVVFVVWFAVVLGVGAYLTARAAGAGTTSSRPDGLRSRVGDVVDVAADRLGRLPTAALLYFAGAGFILAVMWPLGRLAHVVEPSIDVPVFEWFQARQIGGFWSSMWGHLTNIGKPRITQGVALVAAVGFSVAWAVRGRRWWVPLLMFPASYFMVKYSQILLQTVVDRGHPPTTLGTYPSGGCARVVVIYGLVIFCAIHLSRRRRRATWYAGWTLAAFLLSIQAYARTYNLEHWITDVIGGTLMGVLMLIVLTTCFRVLTPGGPGRDALTAADSNGRRTSTQASVRQRG